MSNPLVRDRDLSFMLELHDAAGLCALPAFAEHDSETIELFIASAARLARESLWPAYRAMDDEPPRFTEGRIRLHPVMRGLWAQMVELGVITAARAPEVGGAQLPQTVTTCASLILMAANAAAFGFPMLTSGAAHLIERFGDSATRARFMTPMYEGRWAGTMALTEPHAGSSLADITTRAAPDPDGHFRIRGAKIFISGGDQDITENVVHLTLARIVGAPTGIKGVSLFAVPRLRSEGGTLVDNDVATTQMIHKIGWRGLPSLGLSYGERDDCHGWLVGEPGRGIRNMFQMMNEARISVGANGVGTASAAYHESLAYARERIQGRPPGRREPDAPAVPLLAHADVRRMLLRQKAIVEGGMSLVVQVARFADLAEHGVDDGARTRASAMLDLLTPVAKSFPAEWGYEANSLALQIFGGYGYSSEYLPEAWLRDQRLNSIHEGTTGIQGLDLLGRKVMTRGGEALRHFADALGVDLARAEAAGLSPQWCSALAAARDRVGSLTMHLGRIGLEGDAERMLRHSDDYLRLFAIVAVGWQWLKMATWAHGVPDDPFFAGKVQAAGYWFAHELPRVATIADRIESGEASFADMKPEWF